MSYQPIENYGVVGNMRTVALVSIEGSVDWFCFPHFDSPSVFAALLDDKKGGRFDINSTHEHVKYKQFYWPDTNVLVTRFLSPEGVGELQDFMPVAPHDAGDTADRLIRRVRVPAARWSFASAASRLSTMPVRNMKSRRASTACSSAPRGCRSSW